MRFPDIGLSVPRVLLPRPEVDLEEWAVIACDQHTSNPEYWEEAARLVGSRPSTLHLVLPEAFLDSPGRPGRIRRIHEQMECYLRDGVLQPREPGFVLVDRRTPHAASRKGLIAALDLERYSFAPDASTLIRTTEGTDPGRLPPRVEVREGAVLEVPHILVLIDDPQGTVIEPLFERALPLLYDTELMLGGGRVRGWHVTAEDAIRQAAEALTRLAAPEAVSERYGLETGAPALYAMGDGNHSFAAAREVWNGVKAEAGGVDAATGHPSRHALVELVNLHDPGLRFEPIHRVLFGVDGEELTREMEAFFRGQGSTPRTDVFDSPGSWRRAREDLGARGLHHLPFVAGREDGPPRWGIVVVHDPRHDLEAASLDAFLTDLGSRRGLRLDYIHGEEEVTELGTRPGNAGLLSRALDKHALFRTVLRDGPLPRKSFSLGEAEEKRYYMECRRLIP